MKFTNINYVSHFLDLCVLHVNKIIFITFTDAQRQSLKSKVLMMMGLCARMLTSRRQSTLRNYYPDFRFSIKM